MKARKFYFDIPRLKIGPSKSDNRALRDHLAVHFDSPPPTPRSVRPALPPLVEAELRSACAYVLQNFKPSHIVYDEQYGGSAQKQQLDYAAIKESVQREMEQAAPSAPPLSRARTQEHVVTIMESGDAKPISPDKFKYKPDIATEDLFKDEVDQRTLRWKTAILRAELLMVSQPPKPKAAVTRDRSDPHLRSVSSPMPTSLVRLKTDVAERPWTAPRTDSMETTGWTPQTDTTDYSWSEKASTAMTSAALTPARSSKRTSSQVLQPGPGSGSVPKVEPVDADWMRQELEKHKKASTAMTSAALTPARSSKRTSSQVLQPGPGSGSVPKVEPVDADWMRQELEKHKKAHEESRQQELADDETKAEDATNTTDTTPTQTSTHTATPVAVRMPIRKPVPTSRAASRQGSAHSDSAQDVRVRHDQARSPSTAASETQPPSTSNQQVFSPPPAPRSEAPERPPSRARSVSRRVKDYVRSASAHRTAGPDDVPRPPSRAGNVTRQVKEYFRPSMDAGSRKQSVDIEREESRSVSIDSFHTSASEVAPSTDAGSIKGRKWKPSHRRDRIQTDPYANSRPGTSGSVSESRGRASTRDAQQQSQQTQPRPPINLNRDLPPLPGLDQWKSQEAEQPQAPKQAAPLASSATPMSPRSHRSQRSRHEKPTVSVEPEIGERDEILAARMGSQTPSAHKHSTDVRVPPLPAAPPPTPPVMLSANFSSRDDFEHEHLSPTVSSPETPTVAPATKQDRRRSKSIQTSQPSHLQAGQLSVAERPAFAGKALLGNYSRVAGGPIKGLRRKISKAGHLAATAAPTPAARSQNPSGNLAGKFSMDDAARMHDDQYRNVVEISATPSGAAPAVQAAAEKGKGKWWKGNLKMGKHGGPGSWMDQVVKSGSRSGVLLTDVVPDAPVVRY